MASTETYEEMMARMEAEEQAKNEAWAAYFAYWGIDV